MPLIDEHGRLFGRMNLIDAMIGLFVLVLIPLGYGAYVLFRTPLPTITTVTPAQVTEKQPVRLEIVGTNLRPFLKAHLGAFEAGFLLQHSTHAEVTAPADALPAGVYDLTLSDEAQELVRKPGALTIVAPVVSGVAAPVQLLGEFVGLSPEIARTLRPATTPGGGLTDATVQVLAVRPPLPGVRSVTVGADTVFAAAPNQARVPAIVRVTCAIVDSRCAIGGAVVAPETTVALSVRASGDTAATPQTLAFRVAAVRPADAPAAFAIASLRVRFVGRPEVAQSWKGGDSDLATAGAISAAERASLIALEPDRQSLTATANVAIAPGQTFQVPQPVVSFNGTLRVPVVSTASGWQYKNKAVKLGAPFSFETDAGFAQGWIAGMTIAPLSTGTAR